MTMPKTIWVSVSETVGDCDPEYYWRYGWPSVFKEKRDGSTKYHSEAALIEMLEGMKTNPDYETSWIWCAAIDAMIEKVRAL
jgi:hypothetical protein